jgi:hypothetical protein
VVIDARIDAERDAPSDCMAKSFVNRQKSEKKPDKVSTIPRVHSEFWYGKFGIGASPELATEEAFMLGGCVGRR